jgi:DNA-binding transcriptional ArsR family regulator
MLNYSSSLDGVFHSLADPTRREIVERLTLKSASVKELAEPFDMSLPAVMLHLKILEEAGIVTSRKEGRVRTVSINPEPLLMVDSWMNDRKKTWSRLLDQLDEMLEEEEETV